VLAEAVLRLQCVESEEESRKAPLHAYEPAEKKIGRSPETLALEQFFVLLEFQIRIDPRRSRALRHTRSRNPAPSKPTKGRPPGSSKAGPPAKWGLGEGCTAGAVGGAATGAVAGLLTGAWS